MAASFALVDPSRPHPYCDRFANNPKRAMTDTRAPVLIPETKAFLNVKVLWVRHWNDRLFSFA
ncbi:hypothetical protein ACTGYR_11340, partial [Streptococcus suis]